LSIESVWSFDTQKERESIEMRNSSDLLTTLRLIILVSGMTIGLMERLCGETGEMIKLLVSGKMIGPPTLIE
jgi:hypothetical protein